MHSFCRVYRAAIFSLAVAAPATAAAAVIFYLRLLQRPTVLATALLIMLLLLLLLLLLHKHKTLTDLLLLLRYVRLLFSLYQYVYKHIVCFFLVHYVHIQMNNNGQHTAV